MNLLNKLGITENGDRTSGNNVDEILVNAKALEESVNGFVMALTMTRDNIDTTTSEISTIVSSLNTRLSGLKRAQSVLTNVIDLINHGKGTDK